MSEQREILLTLSPDQHEELAENVAELRRRFDSPNATQAILEAVRRTLAATERREAA